jgi:argininosuccinate lyase
MTLWGGRFSESPADSLFALSRSVQFDWRLAPYDIVSSIAHLDVLESSGLLPKPDCVQIRSALTHLFSEVKGGKFLPNPEDEDVHSALERGLTEKIGVLGSAIRAGRSRNDQVTTDLKLYLIDNMLEISTAVLHLQEALLAKSLEYVDAIAPGFTHLQHAQPVSFGHELAKHAVSLERDLSRISDWMVRTSTSPLGSGALSGSSLPISPESTAKRLGFDSVAQNSIDAVSDRDYVAEALFIIAMIGLHLSRIGEEWSIWSTTEFGWAQLDDAYSTGSSIMPQKKNPDVAELARGKAGRFIGNLTALLTVLKGLPFAYNRDLQEDKEVLFDSVENLLLLLTPVAGMVATTKFNREKMRAAAPLGFTLATEIADYLVRKGVSFAQAHDAAGQCVQIAEARNCDLHELSESELKSAHSQLAGDVIKLLNVEGAIAARATSNGTAPKSVVLQIAKLRSNAALTTKWVETASQKFIGTMTL